jgi:hypothetical protein
LVDGVLEHVHGIEVDHKVFVLARVGDWLGKTEVEEIEAAAHVEQTSNGNLTPRVGRIQMPLWHRGRLIQSEFALLHEDSRQCSCYAFSLRPAYLWSMCGKSLSVAFGYDLALVHDNQGARILT